MRVWTVQFECGAIMRVCSKIFKCVVCEFECVCIECALSYSRLALELPLNNDELDSFRVLELISAGFCH